MHWTIKWAFMVGALFAYTLLWNFAPDLLKLQGTEGTAWLSVVGTWIGSVGTVGTLIGAIWIARRDTRTRTHDAKAAAIIHAANMQHRVQHLRELVENIAKVLACNSGGLVAKNAVRDAITSLASLPQFTSDEIAQLIPLGGNCALTLAGVQSALGNAVSILRTVPLINIQNFGLPPRTGMAVEQISLPLEIIQRQDRRLWHVLTLVQNAIRSAE